MSVLKRSTVPLLYGEMDDVFGNIHAKNKTYSGNTRLLLQPGVFFFQKGKAFILNRPFVYSIMTKSKNNSKISNNFIRTYLFKHGFLLTKQTKLFYIYKRKKEQIQTSTI